MATTGIVYNVLLRGIELPQGATLGWSNEMLHVIAPILMLLDWLFAPGRNRLDWKTIWVIVSFPLVWGIYTLIRGPFVVDEVSGKDYWYPYPFMNPNIGTGRLCDSRVLPGPHRRDHRRGRRPGHLGRRAAASAGPFPPRNNTRARALRLLAVVGIAGVVAALVIIWAARLTIPRDLYVSELGAAGMPTARAFQVALVLIVIGGRRDRLGRARHPQPPAS